MRFQPRLEARSSLTGARARPNSGLPFLPLFRGQSVPGAVDGGQRVPGQTAGKAFAFQPVPFFQFREGAVRRRFGLSGRNSVPLGPKFLPVIRKGGADRLRRDGFRFGGIVARRKFPQTLAQILHGKGPIHRRRLDRDCAHKDDRAGAFLFESFHL